MQPAFTFTSRQDWNNLALGLDSVIKTQLVNSHAKTPFDINLETAFYPNNVLPPPNELEVLDVKTVLPICPPIYVQPSIAQGLQAVAIDDFAAMQITQVLSANNALKRGNIQAAEYLLKRPLTAEEIQNKSVTPQIRQSNSGQNYAVGPRAGPQSITGQAFASQEKKFGDLDARFMKLARQLKLDPAIIEATQQRYNLLRPNPRNSSEASAAAWNAAIEAVEQEVKNQEIALKMHVENTSMSRGSIETLKKREARKARNGQPERYQPESKEESKQREVKQQEQEVYEGYNRDYAPTTSAYHALSILDGYQGRLVPGNPRNEMTHRWVTNLGIDIGDPEHLREVRGNDMLRDYGLYAADDRITGDDRMRMNENFDNIVNELRNRVVVEDQNNNPMDPAEGPDNPPPTPPAMDARAPVAVPGLAVDANDNPIGAEVDPDEGYIEEGTGYNNIAGTQSASASGLGPPHPAPLATTIPLPNLAASSLGNVSLTNLNLGQEEDSESDQKSGLLPSSLYEPVSSLSIVRTLNTAASIPQATIARLDSQIGSIQLGNQPARALNSIVPSGVPNSARPEVQRIRNAINDDADAAYILSRQARLDNHFRAEAYSRLPPERRQSLDAAMERSYNPNNEYKYSSAEDFPVTIESRQSRRRQRTPDENPEDRAYIHRSYIAALRESYQAAVDNGDEENIRHYRDLMHQEVLDFNARGYHPVHNRRSSSADATRNIRYERRYNPGGEGIHGGDIGGGRLERNPRYAKRQRLDEKSRTAGVIHVAGPGPNVMGINGFYGSTAPLTSQLMRQTGRDAVPVSGQVQVNENHQWTEAPLRQFIRQPQVVEDVVAEFEPIAVNTQLRVDKPKASTVFERGHYGKYLINHIALEGKRTFSVSYPSSKKKVRGLPNRQLSNNEYNAVKKVLSGGIIGASDKLTKEERQWMAGMHSKCGVPVHPGLMTKVKSGGRDLIPGDNISGMKTGGAALANVDPKQKIMDILGEMDAGNDNPNLKRQLAAVAGGLFRRHQITPKLYAECKQHWS